MGKITKQQQQQPSRRSTRLHRRKRRMRGGGLDVQKWFKTGIEFHWPGYHYLGPGTHLKAWLSRGDAPINRLDAIAQQHDQDYEAASCLRDKWKADRKMIKAIDTLPGDKTWTESIVRRIMQAKLCLKL